ncbi:fimbrial protein [Paraburkholderia sacchari]|uniref:fimbrial protein n=1 Tax=Paraburkholderia sacchari TaxID=159450 RepID=UPI000541CE75|nr:fimbrial protein [Paraburkholderia sacchari]NLP61778.1 fimbrial protein [Paraburkholderia sacchari]
MEKVSLIRVIWRRFVLLLLLATSSGAWATASCKANYSAFTLSFPSTVAVARDVPNGSLLTAWVQTQQLTNYYTCTVTQQTATGVDFETAGIVSSTPTSYKVSYNGYSVSVYSTNVPGIGIAMGGYINSGGIGWAGFYDFPHLGLQNNPNGTVNNGGQLVAALVKIGDVAPGTLSGMIAQAFSWEGPSNPPAGDNLAAGVINFSISPVAVTVMTCRTPDISVPMGVFKTTDFPGVGSLSPSPASFVVQLQNCPGGAAVSGTQAGQIHSVQYRIDPTNGTLVTNVAALGGSPSATGVGVELFDSTGAVFPLSTNKALSGFNSASGGSYSVPLTARYYRTGTVTPGPADTTMTLTVSYQ